MTKRGEHAWEEIKDSLSLSCGSLIIFYFSYVFSYATLHDVSLATVIHETFCVCVLLWLSATSYQTQQMDWGVEQNSIKKF